jgi:hypothetical protein
MKDRITLKTNRQEILKKLKLRHEEEGHGIVQLESTR